MANNYNIQTGRLLDHNGKTFDITVILNFPTKADYAAATCIDDMPNVNLIDFYFGDTNDGDTDYYVNQFVEKQAKLRKLVSKLIDLSTADNESELAEHIDFVKSLIVALH
jgi:predicted PolB exonuclease-like 3'-5' exonuclease